MLVRPRWRPWTWRFTAPSPPETVRRQQTIPGLKLRFAFRSAVEALYAPYDEVLAGVRAGRWSAIEEATKFLEADPWCFRSGYLKAELMHGLANTPLPSHVIQPLRKVVLRRVVDPQPRLLRFAAQLAANLWDQDFEAQVALLEIEGSTQQRLAAAKLAAGARQRIRSLAGQASSHATMSGGA